MKFDETCRNCRPKPQTLKSKLEASSQRSANNLITNSDLYRTCKKNPVSSNLLGGLFLPSFQTSLFASIEIAFDGQFIADENVRPGTRRKTNLSI
jgi:hypothetical protein